MDPKQQIMNLLKPRRKQGLQPVPKLRDIRDRRTYWFLAALLLGGLLLWLFFSSFKVLVAEAHEDVQIEQLTVTDDERPRCAMGNVVPEPHENHVEFAATWENGSPTGAYPFEFGDGTSTVLTGTAGGIQFSHNYAYEIGGVVTYTAGFTVTNELTTTVCHIENWIVIDDTPIIILPPPDTTQKVFLPLVSNQVPKPTVNLFVTQGSWNHIEVRLIWSGGYDDWHTLDWGDGSTVDIHGADGDEVKSHDYAYPGGDYTLTFTVNGPGGTMTVHTDLHLQPSSAQ